MAETKTEIGLRMAREIGAETAESWAGAPIVAELGNARERRVFAMGVLGGLMVATDETSGWLGDDAENACADADQEDGEIWTKAEDAWVAGFVAKLEEGTEQKQDRPSVPLTEQQERGLARRRKQGSRLVRAWETPSGWVRADLINERRGVVSRLVWNNANGRWQRAM